MELPYNKYVPSDMPDLAWTDFANPRFDFEIVQLVTIEMIILLVL